MPQPYSKLESSNEGQYTDNSSNPDSEIHNDTEGLLAGTPKSRRRSSTWRYVLFGFLSIIASIASFVLGTLLATQIGSVDQICAEHTNSYSPVVKDVNIKYSTIPFNGSLLMTNEYRQPAGPETDAAWEALGVDYHAVRIPDSEAAASGLVSHVRINPKHGGGYPANVEGLHQLHCLNLLRKSLYYNYEHYHSLGHGPFANDDHILQLHVTHCLDIIRQQLMCQVDTGVLGQIWIDPQQPSAYVDFNTQHRCKNFEVVREWAKERQLPTEVPEDFLMPPEGDQIYSVIP